MMAINRYRLRHGVHKKIPGAMRVNKLLERPDRLLGFILMGNTFANMLASSLTAMLVIELFGSYAVIPASLLLTLFVLIFVEITPKTIAALNPERLAFPASAILVICIKIFYPLVWLVSVISNGFLRLFGVKISKKNLDLLTREEMRTVVFEAAGNLMHSYQNMMLGVLDLGGKTVDNIKVHRNDIRGIDLKKPWPQILEQLAHSEHTRLPAYRENIDNVEGVIHLRKALNLAAENRLNEQNLLAIMEEIYFIPEATPLNVQVINFRRERKRIGLVVDEYGEIQGLVTLDDILEEIVGEYTTSLEATYKMAQLQKDGSYLVDGAINISDLNRQAHMELPVEGPKTLSGLIIESLETIPTSAVSLRIDGYPIEVKKIADNTIKLVQVWPQMRQNLEED